jgi:signal transduction histidine kinase
MGVTGRRVRTEAVLGLAIVAFVLCLASALLLAEAAPYLGAVDVWPLPLAGAGYTVVAAYLARSRPRLPHLLVLLLASLALAAPAFSWGLAQHSWSWVAIGTLAVLLVPSVGWVCLVTLRGAGTGRVERQLLAAVWAVSVASTAIGVVVLDPAAWDWCRCAGNPFALTDGPAVFQGLEPWLKAAHLLTVGLVVLAVALTFLKRPGRRRAAEASLVAGLLLAGAAWAIDDIAVIAGTPTNDTMPVLAIGVTMIAAVHAVGVARRRPSRAHVADLLLAARERSDPARMRELVARAMGDDAAAVYWWDADGATYLDHLGRTANIADVPPEHVLKVDSDRRPIARVVTEVPLVDDPAILGPVTEALRLSTENRLLQAELAESLVQVQKSRARIVQASDETRRRIERDLHDGAQQLLISTGAKLNLASTRVDANKDAELAETLADASDELGRALAELRTLARGITPTALVHGSLTDALEDLALRSPVPTSLHVEGAAEVEAEIATTSYFIVAECLANVAKHAHASAAQVHVDLGDPFLVEVKDDGRGGADPSNGSGLRGLADRVATQGGTFDVTTSTTGTTISATLPNGAT